MTNSPVWLITGCSTGIGRTLALEAHAAGHRVVATARRLESLAELLPAPSERLTTCTLDVNDAYQREQAVQHALEKFGRIDVLVNNAGYGLEGAVEECSEAQIREQFDTNFFGLIELTRAVLPTLRAQQSGYIFNISSIAGHRAMGGLGIYNASKFAVTGLSEALAQELAPFGIRVSCVAPGPYRTDWAGRSLQKSEAVAEAAQGASTQSPYAELNKKLLMAIDANSGKQPGDPAQIARVLISAVQHPKPPVHMIFGDVAIGYWQNRMKNLADTGFIQFYPHDRETV